MQTADHKMLSDEPAMSSEQCMSNEQAGIPVIVDVPRIKVGDDGRQVMYHRQTVDKERKLES